MIISSCFVFSKDTKLANTLKNHTNNLKGYVLFCKKNTTKKVNIFSVLYKLKLSFDGTRSYKPAFCKVLHHQKAADEFSVSQTYSIKTTNR